MNELGPDARDALRAARDAFTPDAPRVARMNAAITGSMAAAGMTTGSMLTTTGVKLSLAALVALGSLGGGWWLARGRPTTAAPAISNSPSAAQSPLPRPAPVPEEPPPPANSEVVSAPQPVPRVTRSRVASRSAHRREGPVEVDTLHVEVKLVQAARRALAAHDLSAAARALGEHTERFSQGALREERLALQVALGCMAGDLPAAAARRAELSELAPHSPLLAGPARACEENTGRANGSGGSSR